MKSTSILFVSLAVIAASCQKVYDPEKINHDSSVTLYLSGEKSSTSSSQRTMLSGNDVIWSPSGEYLAVAISDRNNMVEDNKWSEGGPVPEVVACLSSNEGVVTADGSKANFSISFPDKESVPTGGAYRFHAVYPLDATFGLGNISKWDWGVFVGTRSGERGQYPPEGSFDPLADVMLAISRNEYTEITDGMTIDLVFERLCTHARIALKGLPADATIIKAVIYAPEGYSMSGISYINVMNASLSSDKSGRNYVILNYGNDEESGKTGSKSTRASVIGRPVNPDGSFDLLFCTRPMVIAPGDKLQIVLYTDQGTIEKTIIAGASGIRFEQNTLSSVTVGMSAQPLVPYFCHILTAPGSEPVSSLSIPRTGGTSRFYLHSNAGNYANLNIESCNSIYRINSYDAILQEDGSYLMECELLRRPNNSLSSTVANTVPASFSCFGQTMMGYSLEIVQECGAGEIVAGDWTADPVQIGSLRWYPVNLGFDLSHPFGKYYQFGRKAGQYAYCDNPSTKFAVASYDSKYNFAGTPDDDTFYGSSFWWYTYGDPMTTIVRETWLETDTPEELAKGKGNPCPEGWRLPSRDEMLAFITDAGHKNKATRTSHCGASFSSVTSDGTAYIWEVWNSDQDKFLEFPIAGYINGTKTLYNAAGNISGYESISEETFRAYDELSLHRRETESGWGLGMYWAADSDWDVNLLCFNSRGYSSDVSMVTYGYPGWGCSVRCVQSVPESE